MLFHFIWGKKMKKFSFAWKQIKLRKVKLIFLWTFPFDVCDTQKKMLTFSLQNILLRGFSSLSSPPLKFSSQFLSLLISSHLMFSSAFRIFFYLLMKSPSNLQCESENWIDKTQKNLDSHIEFKLVIIRHIWLMAECVKK